MEIKIEGLIPIGIRKISVEHRLYKVYLPTSELWKKLRDEGYELEVFVKPVKRARNNRIR